LIALYFAWQRELGLTWVIALVPSVLVTIYLIRFADLQKYKDSRLGHYVAKYMERKYGADPIAGLCHYANRRLDPRGLDDPDRIASHRGGLGARQERFQKSK